MRPKYFFLALAAITLSGCTKEVSHKLFEQETEIHHMDRMNSAQAAAGARQDGMLYAQHFAGPELNSLGRSKLHLMTQDKPATDPLVVYVNTSDDPQSQARQTAVAKYLAEHGLASAEVQIKTGMNPNAAFPAASALIRYSKTESGSPEGTVNSSGTNIGGTSAAPSNTSAPNR